MRTIKALLLVCALALIYLGYQAGDPSYDLAYNIEGRRYVMDRGLTYDDCQRALHQRPFIFYCTPHP